MFFIINYFFEIYQLKPINNKNLKSVLINKIKLNKDK